MYNSNKRLCNYMLCVWMIPRMYCKKKCYFFSHLIHTFICLLLKSQTIQNNNIRNISHKLFSVAYFHFITFCPSTRAIFAFMCTDVHHNIIFIISTYRDREKHIIVIVINNIMRPYGTQLCFVLTYTIVHLTHAWGTKKMFNKIYEVHFM